jgi:hypothetical protein
MHRDVVYRLLERILRGIDAVGFSAVNIDNPSCTSLRTSKGNRRASRNARGTEVIGLTGSGWIERGPIKS